MKYTEINIKSDMPVVGDAMKYLQDTILRLKKEKCECVLIVHGYGSTGKGGAIREKARQWQPYGSRTYLSQNDKSVSLCPTFELKGVHRSKKFSADFLFGGVKQF